MTKQIDLERYSHFVAGVTSLSSNSTGAFIDRVSELADANPDIHISLLLTAAIGLGSESGEFQEIVKKIIFQGKPLNDESKFHMFRELGDVLT